MHDAVAEQINPLIAVKQMVTAFEGRVVHNELDLDVFANEVLVLLGGSGSGKSTLLRCLIGLESAVSGQCLFHGDDLFVLRDSEWPKLRQKIAYAFQNGALFDSLSVTENLEFPLIEHTTLTAKERHDLIAEMLASLGLAGTEKLFPAELSGGMQKRLGLARALMLDPEVILYDEPTAGLDPANVKRINETILNLKSKGKTSIVVTHDEACALGVADRFAFIKDGRIAAVQTKDEFKRQPKPELSAYFSGN